MRGTGQHAGRATLADVAQRAGVSNSTASIAFSGTGPIAESTRERVLSAAAELGYDGPDPRAKSLRQGRSGVVGVVLDSRLLYAFRDPVTSITLDGIASALGPDRGDGDSAEGGTPQQSTGLLLLTDEGTGDATIESAAVDAVILLGCSARFDRSIEVFLRREIPVVSVEGPHRPDVFEVSLDNRRASAAAARYIEGLGHERVAVVALSVDADHTSGPIHASTTITTTVNYERLRGVREVFPDAVAHSSSNNTPEDGRLAALALLDRPAAQRPTAILAQADLLAVGVIQAVEELGLSVPGDVSVLGFDGIRIDGLAHDLTTMVQPAAEKGQAAGRAVTELLAGGHPASQSFTCVLHVGTTTGPPR
jgi:DNA-binding LacI/PurR family transcriptional regulator